MTQYPHDTRKYVVTKQKEVNYIQTIKDIESCEVFEDEGENLIVIVTVAGYVMTLKPVPFYRHPNHINNFFSLYPFGLHILW